MKRNLLCIETTLAKCSVCLSCDGQEEFMAAEEEFAHSEKLFLLIESLLNKCGLDYADLDFIACTVGPGSFGGIRVGVAAVNALKILLPKVQVLGFNTLDVVASFERGLLPGAVVVAAIAHGNKCYVAKVDGQGQILEVARAIHKDELSQLSQMWGADRVLITTDVSISTASAAVSKIVDLDARAVMRFAQKIIHENRINLYNQVSPIYVSEPSITVAK